MSPQPARLQLYAVVAPGLEATLADEMRELGLDPGPPEHGGIPFTGGLDAVLRANLHLRTATRVLVRLGQPFRARAASELTRKAAQLPWEEWLPRGEGAARIRIQASSHGSRLYHTGLIAQAVGEGIAARTGGASPTELADAREGEGTRILVRLARDTCTVSLDSSGELLHRRGWRLEGGRAPLRETLAAALLRLAGWRPGEPLVDPMCGSGTLLIEAALLAAGQPPGLHRDFPFLSWPCFDLPAGRELLEQARTRLPDPPAAPILGGDRDAATLAVARANAERAGVETRVSLQQADMEQLPFPQGPGLVLSNPPYGGRLGSPEGLTGFYRRLGRMLRARGSGWRIGLLVGARSPAQELGLRWERQIELSNGGLPVRFLVTRIA